MDGDGNDRGGWMVEPFGWEPVGSSGFLGNPLEDPLGLNRNDVMSDPLEFNSFDDVGIGSNNESFNMNPMALGGDLVDMDPLSQGDMIGYEPGGCPKDVDNFSPGGPIVGMEGLDGMNEQPNVRTAR